MPRLLTPLLSLLVVGGIAGVVFWGSWTEEPAAPPVAPTPLAAPVMPAGLPTATVEYVHDGDTLFLTDGTKVRLLAVDTPEIGAEAECFGAEATAYLQGLLPAGTVVSLQADVEPLDQYGRALYFVWLPDGSLVNLALVQNGYAEAVFIGANRVFEAEVEAAEGVAVAGGTGMWGACV